MKNYIVFVFLLSVCGSAFSQQSPKGESVIQGKILGVNSQSDSIFFFWGQINPKYFNNTRLSSKVINENYKLTATPGEPKMYRIVLLSDRGQLIWRAGKYFIDNSTTSINSDLKNNECNTVDGITANEYYNVFIPFMFDHKETYRCDGREMEGLEESRELGFDSLLYSYVKKYPSSYVGLWELINRFDRFGHTKLRNKILDSFSGKIKSGHLWNTLNNDFQNILMREQENFPIINVKDIDHKQQKLLFQKGRYTLVDFWFSRCKPCLETFPNLKKIYEKYNKVGFNIIGISTDKSTENGLWEKTIEAYGLPWTNYLDENAAESKKLLISYFPTNFLLDYKGRVIKKNIDERSLGLFLKNNLPER